MNRSRNLMLAAAVALSFFLAAAPAVAQGWLPTQPLHIIVNSPPGSILDTHARRIGDKLTVSLGQPVIVDNRPGGRQRPHRGRTRRQRAKPDGHALLFTDNGVLTINRSACSRAAASS
jgi:tripartite-type tricarboxylate transporter receptor subunit TctC